jgi:hypothetical protein
VSGTACLKAWVKIFLYPLELAVRDLRLRGDDRRTRLIVFIVITLVFLFSVAALLYWAITVAAARISSRVAAHFLIVNPLAFLEL